MDTTSRPLESERRLWLLFAVLLIALLLLTALRWMLEHPYGFDADEAWYINEAQIDSQVLHLHGLVPLARWLVHGDTNRPPAYRLVVFPFLAVLGYHTVVVRLVTFACFVVSAWFIYLTTRRLAGATAGAIAVLVFSLSPEILQSSIFYSTEGPLYLAVAGTMLFASVYWSNNPEPAGNWIGLGLSIGLGALSKITFASIALPVLVVSIFAAYRHRGISGLISLAKGGALALVVAAFWWFKNIRPALGYAIYSNKGWIRHSLGAHSLMTFARWIGSVFLSLVGPGSGILIGLLLIAYLRRAALGGGVVLKPLHRTALLVCACGTLPIVAAQLTGTNYNLRLISAAMIPIAIAVGVLSDATGWIRFRMPMAVSGLLFVVQFLMLVSPVLFPNKHTIDPGSFNAIPWRVMIRFEQWDWKPLRDISNSCGVETRQISYVADRRAFNGQLEYGWSNPIGTRISYMGSGRGFNGSQIQYPWIAQGAPAPDVTWLWRYEDGPIDWQKVLNLADHSDIVITAPHYVGELSDRQDVDNENNAEFAKRLAQDQHFRGPIHLEMGQLDPVEVQVFLNTGLACNYRNGIRF